LGEKNSLWPLAFSLGFRLLVTWYLALRAYGQFTTLHRTSPAVATYSFPAVLISVTSVISDKVLFSNRQITRSPDQPDHARSPDLVVDLF
jgi:hypothetical protein